MANFGERGADDWRTCEPGSRRGVAGIGKFKSDKFRATIDPGWGGTEQTASVGARLWECRGRNFCDYGAIMPNKKEA